MPESAANTGPILLDAELLPWIGGDLGRGAASMQLIDFDETGNTGENLDDPQQPVFVLGALIVPEARWQRLEQALEATLAARFPAVAADGAEIHGKDLRNGTGPFRGVAPSDRVALRDAWLRVAASHSLKFVYRSIVKKNDKKWLDETVGDVINPHIVAFPMVSQVVKEYLAEQGALGIFISDELEIVVDIERAIRELRLSPGPLRLSQIIEKGFFIESAKSRILQLCDVCVLQARRKEEHRIGGDARSIDAEGAQADRAADASRQRTDEGCAGVAEATPGRAEGRRLFEVRGAARG